MTQFLKQSTAFTFRIGPFLDDTDGKTAETGLTIAQADIQISKAGGAFAQTSASPTTTHDTDGWYQCPLTTTDTNTLGMLDVQIAIAGALPVWKHFMVVTANVFDSLCSTDVLDVSMTQILGTAVSSPATAGVLDINVKNIANAAVNTSSAQLGVNVVTQANIDFGALQKTSLNAATPASVTGAVGSVTGAVGSVTGAVGSVTGNVGGNVAGSVGSVTGAVGSVTGNVGGNVTGSVGSVAANGITATSIAADAINAAALKADAVTKVQNGLATPTNITAGTITTVTNLTNAPTNGDLTATMKTSVTTAATAATPTVLLTAGTGTGQLDFTGGVVKANLAQILGTALSETSGYIAAAFKQFFNVASPTGTMKAITAVDTVTNLTNAPTAGDLTATMKTSVTTAATAATPTAAAVTGAVGSVTGNVGGNVTGSVGSVSGAVGSVTSGVTVTTNNDKTGYALSAAGVQAIWDALTAALTTAGSIGKLLVDNINATIGSRSTYAGGDTAGTTMLLSRIVGTLATGTHNPQTGDAYARLGAPAGASVSADIATVATYVDTEVAAIKTVTDKLGTAVELDGAVYRLTANALELAPTDGSAPTVAQIRAEMDANSTQLAAIVADTNELQTDLVNGGRLDLLVDAIKAKTDNLPSDPADESLLEAAITAATSPLATATALATVAGYVDTEVAAILAAVDTEVAAIKAKTDNLPASPAAVGSAMTLTAAYDAAKTAATQTSVDDIPTNAELATALAGADDAVLAAIAALNNLSSAGAQSAAAAALTAYGAALQTSVDDLEGRLTATRAGYLDNLSGGAVATAAALTAVDDYVDTEVAAIKAVTDKLDTALVLDGAVYQLTANALELAPTGGSAPTAAQIRAEMDANSTQLAAILADTGTDIPATLSTISGYIDTEVAAILAAVDTEVAAIKAKTDNLPSDPADQSAVEAALTAATSPLATAANLATLTGYVDTEVAAIKAKTDNLPSDPADQSAVEAALTAATSPLATAANLATLTGYVDTEVAAIKAKTDNLPAAPAGAGDIPSAAAVADQVRTELTTELAYLDANVSSRAAAGAAMTLAANAVNATALADDAVAELVAAIGGDIVVDIDEAALAVAVTAGVLDASLAGHMIPNSFGGKLNALDTSKFTVISVANGGVLTATRWVTFLWSASGLTIPAGWTKAWFTVKDEVEDTDEEAVIQIELSNPAAGTDGMKVLMGETAANLTAGSLDLDQVAGTAAIVLTDETTGMLIERSGELWDIKVLVAGDSTSQQVITGTMNIYTAVTREV